MKLRTKLIAGIRHSRYIILLLLLATSFKYLSITQPSPDMAVPVDYFEQGAELSNYLFYLLIAELALLAVDSIFRIKQRITASIVYYGALLFSFIVYLYGFEDFVLQLNTTRPTISEWVTNAFVIGIPIAVTITLMLTLSRRKAARPTAVEA